MRATSRLVIEGDDLSFGGVLTFFEGAADAARAEERSAVVGAELEAALRSFGEFRAVADVTGVVLGAIRVDAATPGLRVLIGVGRADPPAAVPGQQSVFVARLRGTDGTEVLIHVAGDTPRDVWPNADFLGLGVVTHVDRGHAMP